jgi:hypothetical protein
MQNIASRIAVAAPPRGHELNTTRIYSLSCNHIKREGGSCLAHPTPVGTRG